APVGEGPYELVTDDATGTLYVTDFGFDFTGHNVYVIDGAHCCTVLGTITAGRIPQEMQVDPATRTLYVANQAFEEEPGSVSVVDLRHGTARDTGGCGATPARVATGFGTAGLTLDRAGHRVFTADLANATISIIDGASCNALRPAGCARGSTQKAVGAFPIDV